MNLSLEEKIGQRFIMGVNNSNINDIIKLINNNFLGGVILYKKNYNNYNEMIKVIKKLKDANRSNKIPLFIAIDQEGGLVNRFPKEFHNLKNIYDVSKYDQELISSYSSIIADMLSSNGINMNFAPVMDINNSESKVMYHRCFFGNETSIGDYSIKYIDELNKHNIISVAKHFPGHGITKIDSHFIIPYIFNYHKVLNKHIIPFNDVLDKDAIMVGHIIIRKLTRLLPASISNYFLKNYLRNKYNGLIITDEINMLKRNLFYHFIYLKKMLTSESDLILVKINKYKDGYKILEKYKKILKKEKYLNELDNKIDRILTIKKKYNITDNINFVDCDIDKINGLIDNLNNKIK